MAKKKTKKTITKKKAAAKAKPKAAAKAKPKAKAKAKKVAAVRLPPKASAAVRKAADAIWDTKVAPHTLLKELHEVLLLRCLKDAGGNYAAAAERFGPSRQSVQQYANSPLRDSRWKSFQQG
jgi:hypothetical protein